MITMCHGDYVIRRVHCSCAARFSRCHGRPAHWPFALAAPGAVWRGGLSTRGTNEAEITPRALAVMHVSYSGSSEQRHSQPLTVTGKAIHHGPVRSYTAEREREHGADREGERKDTECLH